MSGPEPDEFVSGSSVDWRGIAAAFGGAVVATVAYAAASTVGMIGGAVERALGGFEWFATALLSAPFEGADRVITASWRAFGEFAVYLGPFAFPVTVGVSAFVLLVILWGVSRFVRF